MRKGLIVRIEKNARSLTLSLDSILNAAIPWVIMPRSRDDSMRHEKSATSMIVRVRMIGCKSSMVNCNRVFQAFMLGPRILVLLSAQKG